MDKMALNKTTQL